MFASSPERGSFFVWRYSLRRGNYPLRLTTFASSPKGTPFGNAVKLPITAEAVPLGKVASPQAMTEGVPHP